MQTGKNIQVGTGSRLHRIEALVSDAKKMPIFRILNIGVCAPHQNKQTNMPISVCAPRLAIIHVVDPYWFCE